MLVIIKANGYGHDTPACAQVLVAENPRAWLGVTGVEEGAAVRAVAPQAHILAMGSVWREEAAAAIAYRLTPVVWEPSQFEPLQTAAQACGLAAASFPVHLEIDTGMSRQGVRPECLPVVLTHLAASSALRLEGVLTHLHSPEALDGRANDAQLREFETALNTIAAHGLHPEWIHAGNSATILNQGGAADIVQIASRHGAKAMLRPGLALYGYAPRFSSTGPSLSGSSEAGSNSADAFSTAPALQLVLSWKTRIISLRIIQSGDTAGYCATFKAARPTRIALLPAGYADGLNRQLSNRGTVLVRGQRAPIAGRVSMDLTTIDVTNIPGVEIGDEVVIIGEQGSRSITAYDHADLVNTIPYEILCNIAARVPRIVKD